MKTVVRMPGPSSVLKRCTLKVTPVTAPTLSAVFAEGW
jgi:hypothetical protein